MLANRIAIPIAWSTTAIVPCQEAPLPASRTIVTAPPASEPFARSRTAQVHENLCPGAVARVTVFDDEGGELEVWRAGELGPTREPARVLRIDLPLGFVVERVRLHLRSDAVAGWNEIDAVGLRDVMGAMHWAARAEASSTYASVGQGNRFQRPPEAPKPAAAPVPAAPARPAARDRTGIDRLEARIRELEQELARLRAELAKARADGGR